MMLDPFGQPNLDDQQTGRDQVTAPSFDDVFSELAGVEFEPEEAPVQQQDTRQFIDNDQVRYQYWQSQADKLKNEVEELKVLVNQRPVQEEKPEEPVRFPDPPAAPRKPAAFTYEEAMSDPRSMSAQYLAEKEEYDRNLHDYNSIRVEFELAQLRKAQEDLKHERESVSQQVEAERQRELQMRGAAQAAMQRYGADPATALRFVHEMSSPESITMDNLWALFAMRSQGREPSQQFRQTQRAQQVAPPMGVMPGGGQQPLGKSVDDIIMDGLIDMQTRANPW
jgi:hypothetical protein